mgnify:CR=1 FL=1
MERGVGSNEENNNGNDFAAEDTATRTSFDNTGTRDEHQQRHQDDDAETSLLTTSIKRLDLVMNEWLTTTLTVPKCSVVSMIAELDKV